jgi:hypothetical protein
MEPLWSRLATKGAFFQQKVMETTRDRGGNGSD